MHEAGNLILSAHLQEVITELKKRVEEFEQTYSKVEKESHARLKEAEEAQIRVSQLQENIERYQILSICLSSFVRIINSVMTTSTLHLFRLEVNLSNLESENQVLRQQALVASAKEDFTEEMEL